MAESGSLLALLRDPCLSPHAASDHPAWLWSADASRMLWANAAGAAIFRIGSPAALVNHAIGPKDSAALQIARIAGTLVQGAAPRLERLRGFGGRFGGAQMCGCSRVMLADRMPAILVVATETPGPRLTLAEHAHRLLSGIPEPVALFGGDGTLLHATPAARERLGQATALTGLDAGSLAPVALSAGHASGDHEAGRFTLDRIGSGAATMLLVSFEEQPAAAAGSSARQTSPVEPPTPAPGTAPPTAQEPAPAEPPAASPAATPKTPTTPRQPLRFVWQMDQDNRFSVDSEEFRALIGPRIAAVLGRPWGEIAAELELDPEGQVARALATRETWSGIAVAFPVDGNDARFAVELSGLPVFDRDRSFRGYRGFGVCREVARLPKRPESDTPRAEPPMFRHEPPSLSVVPPVENVVPFRSPAPDKPPTLTPVEHNTFSELASRLSARLRGQDQPGDKPESMTPPSEKAAAPVDGARKARGETSVPAADQRPILDRLPVGVLVYRLDRLIYANRPFLDWTGYDNLHALESAGGLDALFVEPSENGPGANNGSKALTIATNKGDQLPVDARLFTSPWEGELALVLMLTGVGTERRQKAEASAQPEASDAHVILDATADGVVVIDQARSVLLANRSAETLFGYRSGEMTGAAFVSLFTPDTQRAALDEVNAAHAADEGREMNGRRRDGGTIALLMTARPIGGADDRICVTFRDITRWKRSESDILDAKRQAELASAAKSDFLAKISHEIRTPLNSIIGFTEVMMQERLGPIGNDRYRQYLKDIRNSGGHLVALLNDLLDLSKIEAGKLELTFADVNLNALTNECVALMQPQASRERIIIRTSLAADLPPVTADAKSVRQIALNLLANSIKYTGAGGQVIISTARNDGGDVVLRVRDTGIGMSEQDLAVALEPFRQLAVSSRLGSSGTGLGLPLTKALAEANRASFSIRSAIHSGTLVEVAFSGTQLAAE